MIRFQTNFSRATLILLLISILLVANPGTAAPPLPGDPFNTRDNKEGQGAINVLYADQEWPFGLTADDDQLWNQDSPEVKEEAEMGDHFGGALASGDFNCDGYDDLAIGVPDEDIEGNLVIEAAGAVNVIYGTADGLSPVETSTHLGDQVWHQDSTGIHGVAQAGDYFGQTLAAGNFNGDFCDDLVIGVPGETIESSGKVSAGAVNVIYGSYEGLSPVADIGGLLIDNQVWTQDSPDVDGTAVAFGQFGYALATGDFNDDGYDDLAVGAPFITVDEQGYAGTVNILYGSTLGLDTESNYGSGRENQLIVQAFPHLGEIPEAHDYFGFALTAGRFDNDGTDDLAIGVPGEDDFTGKVHVLYGSDIYHYNGLQLVGIDTFNGSMPYWDEYPEAGDQFGFALAAGNFGYSDHDDLAVGVPTEDRETPGYTTVIDSGIVQVLFGSIDGLTDTDGLVLLPWWGLSCDLAGDSTYYGFTLSAGDFNPGAANWYDDLVVGAPGSNYSAIGCLEQGIGMIFVHQGTELGPDFFNMIWSQDVYSVIGTPSPGDFFGLALTTGDFNNDGKTDLAVGVPGDSDRKPGGAAARPRR